METETEMGGLCEERLGDIERGVEMGETTVKLDQ